MNTRRSIHAALLGCVVATLTCGTATVASAGELVARSVTVQYDDLNIANPAGARKLYSRIRAAAKTVCGTRDPSSLSMKSGARKCEAQAIDDAVSRVNNRVLTAMHKQKTTRRYG